MTLARNLFVDWARRAGAGMPSPISWTATSKGAPEARPRRPAWPMPAGDDGSGVGAGRAFAPSVVALANAYVRACQDELRRVHHQRFVLAAPQREAAEALGISARRCEPWKRS